MSKTTLYLTYCSARKSDHGTTVNNLYKSPRITKFITTTTSHNWEWSIFSDLYSVMEHNTIYQPYEKAPWDVDEEELVQLANMAYNRVNHYDKVIFMIDPATHHKTYQRIIDHLIMMGVNVEVQDINTW